jgi:hypothetical protein
MWQRPKAILDKERTPDQKIDLPYLAGYVAFYGGDYLQRRIRLPTELSNDDTG